MPNDTVTALIDRLAPKYGLDPAAVKAVALGEGGLRWGAVGDGGHAFGPFQLNNAGGVITGRPGNHAAFANSPAGLEFALRLMGRSAAGLRGGSAVEAIIRKFERPADPDTSVRNALARLGSVPKMARGSLPAPSGGAAAAPALTPAIAALLDSNNQILGTPSTFSAFASMPTLTQEPAVAAPPVQPKPPRIKGAGVKFLTQFAAPYGLTVTSTTSGNHVKNSYHYRGKAVDFGGDPARLGALAEAALRNPQQFAEMFYSGPGNPGFYIKDGVVYPLDQLDPKVRDNHTTHVHLATR